MSRERSCCALETVEWLVAAIAATGAATNDRAAIELMIAMVRDLT
jgi:hypothetical protein